MSTNRPSRWLAPLSLLAVLVVVLMLVAGSTGDEESQTDNAARTEERGETSTSTDEERDEAETTARTSTTPQRRTYTVKSGDTLALISERTGITVEELQELNPDIDPNSLTVGEKIKLAE